MVFIQQKGQIIDYLRAQDGRYKIITTALSGGQEPRIGLSEQQLMTSSYTPLQRKRLKRAYRKRFKRFNRFSELIRRRRKDELLDEQRWFCRLCGKKTRKERKELIEANTKTIWPKTILTPSSRLNRTLLTRYASGIPTIYFNPIYNLHIHIVWHFLFRFRRLFFLL